MSRQSTSGAKPTPKAYQLAEKKPVGEDFGFSLYRKKMDKWRNYMLDANAREPKIHEKRLGSTHQFTLHPAMFGVNKWSGDYEPRAIRPREGAEWLPDDGHVKGRAAAIPQENLSIGSNLKDHPIWFKKPGILLDRLDEIVPGSDWKMNRQLNAIFRLSIVIAVTLSLFMKNLIFMLIIVIGMYVSWRNADFDIEELGNPIGGHHRIDGASRNRSKAAAADAGDNSAYTTSIIRAIEQGMAQRNGDTPLDREIGLSDLSFQEAKNSSPTTGELRDAGTNSYLEDELMNPEPRPHGPIRRQFGPPGPDFVLCQERDRRPKPVYRGDGRTVGDARYLAPIQPGDPQLLSRGESMQNDPNIGPQVLLQARIGQRKMNRMGTQGAAHRHVPGTFRSPSERAPFNADKKTSLRARLGNEEASRQFIDRRRQIGAGDQFNYTKTIDLFPEHHNGRYDYLGRPYDPDAVFMSRGPQVMKVRTRKSRMGTGRSYTRSYLNQYENFKEKGPVSSNVVRKRF